LRFKVKSFFRTQSLIFKKVLTLNVIIVGFAVAVANDDVVAVTGDVVAVAAVTADVVVVAVAAVVATVDSGDDFDDNSIFQLMITKVKIIIKIY